MSIFWTTAEVDCLNDERIDADGSHAYDRITGTLKAGSSTGSKGLCGLKRTISTWYFHRIKTRLWPVGVLAVANR